MTVVHQAPLFMGFPRQEYWSGFLFSSQGDLPEPGIEPVASAAWPALQADSLPSEPPRILVAQEVATNFRKHKNTGVGSLSILQGIFLTQESNGDLLHCRQILLPAELPGVI